MKTAWLKQYDNKKILILGFGREGQSTYRTLKKFCSGCNIQIMDRNSDYVRQVLGDDRWASVYDAAEYLKPDSDIDVVFKSPGIPLKHMENVWTKDQITSQSEGFIRAYREKIIGITGTKGKSTTASFVHALLEAHGEKAVLVGNIGKPPFDYIEKGEGTPWFVYELSSHQLETVDVSPKYSAILNIFEEHLDHYHSYDHYVEAKMNIGRFQEARDFFLVNQSLKTRTDDFLAKRLIIGDASVQEGIADLCDGVAIRWDQGLTMDDGIDRQVVGHHNLVNMASGMLLVRLAGFSDSAIELSVLKTFKGLKHRLAYVATVNGIDYYNDSISTIPKATVEAVKAIPNTKTVIVGGMDRGIDYSDLVVFVEERQDLNWILLPDSGHTIYEALAVKEHAVKVVDMKAAVLEASRRTPQGSACVLSPAAASYGFYRDFEARGEHFESLVNGLTT